MICPCRCHVAPDALRLFYMPGVDTRDVIEAAVACPLCVDQHVDALLLMTLPFEDVSPTRGVIVEVTTPEGKKMSWAEYQAEMEKRAESWRQQGGGENCA